MKQQGFYLIYAPSIAYVLINEPWFVVVIVKIHFENQNLLRAVYTFLKVFFKLEPCFGSLIAQSSQCQTALSRVGHHKRSDKVPLPYLWLPCPEKSSNVSDFMNVLAMFDFPPTSG